MGRKNWFFAGSDKGAERAAILCTVLESAARHGLDLGLYLRDVMLKLRWGLAAISSGRAPPSSLVHAPRRGGSCRRACSGAAQPRSRVADAQLGGAPSFALSRILVFLGRLRRIELEHLAAGASALSSGTCSLAGAYIPGNDARSTTAASQEAAVYRARPALHRAGNKNNWLRVEGQEKVSSPALTLILILLSRLNPPPQG